MDNYEFANRISELRKQKGLSQKELGDLLGVSNKAVSKWENGESMPKTSTMIKLAELFSIDANELIGFEANKVNESSVNQIELDKLKTENRMLNSKLETMNKKRKKNLIIVSIICIIGIIASAIIGFSVKGDNSINKNIKDAGMEGTKIVFAEKNFIPSNDFQNYILKSYMSDYEYSYTLPESKYAEYYDSESKSQKVLVNCNSDYDVIELVVKNKSYYYVYEKSYISNSLNANDVFGIELYNESKTKNSYLDYDYEYERNYDYDKVIYSYEKIFAFCNFYNNKGKPVDKKITERYLGNEPYSVTIEFKTNYLNLDYNYVSIGEFFSDNKGNMYFYDYVSGNAYEVGKELNRIVKGK